MTTREIIIIVALIAVSIFGVATCHYKSELKKEYDKVLSINDSTKNVMKKYIDDNGTLHGQVESFTADKKIYDETNKKYIDSIAKLSNTKAKNINNITTIGTNTHGSFHAPVDSADRITTTLSGRDTVRDTVKFYYFNYNDRWLSFQGDITADSISGVYSIVDSLTILTIQKRTKLSKLDFIHLGPMKTFVDVSSSNPNTTYLNMKNIELTDIKKLHWSVGPYIGYGFNGVSWTPNIGISVQRILFKF